VQPALPGIERRLITQDYVVPAAREASVLRPLRVRLMLTPSHLIELGRWTQHTCAQDPVNI